MPHEPFSDRLDAWLGQDAPRTLGSLGEVFAEKGFVVVVMLLMLPAAVPAPTGGITHVFEAIAALLGGQMVFGRRSLWFPGGWRDRPLPDSLTDRFLPSMVTKIRRLEAHSHPRGAAWLKRDWMLRVLGLAVIGFAAAAFFSPPFSGLDTLPALGSVVFALGVVLDDLLLVGVGFAIGVAGITLTLTVGAAVIGLMGKVTDVARDHVSGWWADSGGYGGSMFGVGLPELLLVVVVLVVLYWLIARRGR